MHMGPEPRDKTRFINKAFHFEAAVPGIVCYFYCNYFVVVEIPGSCGVGV